MIKSDRFLLLLVFLLSFFIRSYHVDQIPPLLWDEASLGYNAYSIIHTGRDEYGRILPLVFKSFGDYKPGLYVYLAIPSIIIFGLNSFAIRLPSILAGSFIPIILYLLLKGKSQKLAIIVSLISSLSPFGIHFSRGAWETNILSLQVLLSLFLITNNRSFASSLVLSSSLYTYQSAKLIAPIVAIFLFIQYRPRISRFLLPILIISIPLLYGLIFQSDTNRLQVVSLFSYPRSELESQTIISESSISDYNLFHNRFIFFARNFFSRYANHFSSRFLSFEGDWQNPRHSAIYTGVLLFPSVFFLIIGLFFHRHTQPLNRFFIFWLILAPIPSALTRDSLSAVRAMSLSIPLAFFISYGIYLFANRYKYPTLTIISIVYLFSFAYYADMYLNHTIKRSPKDYLYGYQSAIDFLLDNQSKYANITFTNFYGQAYIYYLFFSQYPPHQYQQQASLILNSLDTGTVDHIDNVRFGEANFQSIKDQPSTLAVFSHDEVLRQNIDTKQLIPLSPVGDYSTFYGYTNY